MSLGCITVKYLNIPELFASYIWWRQPLFHRQLGELGKDMEREHQIFKYSVMKDEIETVPCMYSKLLGRNENIYEVFLQIMNLKN